MNTRTSLSAVLMVAVAMLLPTTGQAQGPDSNPAEGVDEGKAPITVTIKSSYWGVLQIYAVGAAGGWERLTQISANGTVTDTIPANLVGSDDQLRFRLDPVGASQTTLTGQRRPYPQRKVLMTEPIMVQPGDHVVLRPHDRLQQTAVYRRSGGI